MRTVASSYCIMRQEQDPEFPPHFPVRGEERTYVSVGCTIGYNYASHLLKCWYIFSSIFLSTKYQASTPHLASQ